MPRYLRTSSPRKDGATDPAPPRADDSAGVALELHRTFHPAARSRLALRMIPHPEPGAGDGEVEQQHFFWRKGGRGDFRKWKRGHGCFSESVCVSVVPWWFFRK
ncbi:hypothetical protein CEXT_370361 [Caerostris extrusa]|uniref:Uncharacterized protein n=1 Tax=Caerostris extrusa TaxID=172846 RepID=A0AAV4NDN6_CAEEX|nr:hypothetical protein CEXT_370361 [Caerostris extrusa]